MHNSIYYSFCEYYMRYNITYIVLIGLGLGHIMVLVPRHLLALPPRLLLPRSLRHLGHYSSSPACIGDISHNVSHLTCCVVMFY